MIRNHTKAAVPRLTVKDVNFDFSCFVHNNGILFSASPVSYCFCVSSGQLVPLNFGLQDTLPYKVLKKMCNSVSIQLFHFNRKLVTPPLHDEQFS